MAARTPGANGAGIGLDMTAIRPGHGIENIAGMRFASPFSS
jgi:hypothetical protein